MANKVKIYSTLKSGKVSFDGSRVNNKEIGSLEVEAHPTLSNRIRIKSLTQFKRGSDTQYRVFFGKLNINRIQNEAGQDLVADLGMDRDAVIAYIQTQITKPIVTEYFEYNPITDRLEANKNIEVKKHGFFIGGKYKMASGNSNLYYEDLATGGNSYPVMGEVFDQSVAENQVAGAGTTTPKMRVFGDFQTIPLGGSPVNDTAIGYDGDNFFPFNISGVGITCRIAEPVTAQQQLKYEIIIDGISVYIQYLEKQALSVNQDLTWFFDHPLDVEAGTTLRATIYKVSTVDNQEVIDGVLQVCEGDATPTRYQTNVMNRFFEDKDLEQISPYIKYQAIDFSLDATGSHIILKDLSLGSGSDVLTHYPINGIEAVANGTNIQIKVKDGAKIIVTSAPVSGFSIDGFAVNSVLNQAVVQLNSIFTNVDGFSGGGNPVTNFAISGDDLTITLEDLSSFTVDVTTLGVDENNFVVSGALSGSDLILTMTDGSTVTIDASNMINGSTLPAMSAGWYFMSTDNLVTSNKINNNIRGHQPFYNGTLLDKGTEFLFNNEPIYGFAIGVYDENGNVPTNGTDGQLATNWTTMFRFNNLSGTAHWSASDSQSIDLTSDYTMVNDNAPMLLRYTSDNYLKLIEILANGDEVVIATSSVQQVGDSLSISFAGWSAGSVFPTFIKRSENWTIVHDFDNSENGIYNNIEDHTVIRSNIQVAQGEKYMINLTADGRANFFGTDYNLASSGETTAESSLDNRFTYGTSEQLLSGSDWTLNTSAVHYDANLGAGAWRANGNGNPIGMISLRYQSDNTLELWSEEEGELIMTCNQLADGNPIHLYYGVRENTLYQHLPTVSKQDITQGTQPITTYAPNVPDQVFYIEEGNSMNAQLIVIDYIVNQWVEINAPSWITMNQNTGVLSGVAPSWTNSSADAIVINCKAANAIGGTTNFLATVNVYQSTYTNSQSVRFDAGQNSYFSGNSANVSSLQRTGNPAAASAADEWTIAMWVKLGDNTGNPYFSYGSSNNTDGYIELRETADDRLRFRYGTSSDYLQLQSAANGLSSGWNHIMMTYNGGPTDSYQFTNFSMYINGVLQTTSNATSTSGGFSGNLGTGFMYVGRFSNTYLDNGMVDQLAIWNSDKTSDAADIYNSGTAQNLEWSQPDHYYEFGSSVTTVNDVEGNANLTGFNLNINDLVTDTP